jgi:opacity protein-like surface antigen
VKKQFITLATLALVGGAAQAQAPTFSGFKLGLSLGQLEHTASWRDTAYDWYGGSMQFTKRKVAPALHVGYDRQVDTFVYGVELDHTFASAKSSTWYDTRITGTTPTVVVDNELKSVTTLRGRMGVANGSSLIYLTAGVAKAKVNHVWTENGDPNDSWNFSNNRLGYVTGVGLEHKINGKFSFRAEMLRTTQPEERSVNANDYMMDVNNTINTFRVGFTYNF